MQGGHITIRIPRFTIPLPGSRWIILGLPALVLLGLWTWGWYREVSTLTGWNERLEHLVRVIHMLEP